MKLNLIAAAAAVIAGTVVPGPSAQAANYYWSLACSNDVWTNPNCWTASYGGQPANVVPGVADLPIFFNDTSNDIVARLPEPAGDVPFYIYQLDARGSGGMTVRQTGGTVNVNYISGSASFEQSGGTNHFSHNLALFDQSHYTLSGTAELIGQLSMYGGTFDQLGGTFSGSHPAIGGYYSNAPSTFNLAGGSFTSTSTVIAASGAPGGASGSFVQSGGTHTVAGDLVLTDGLASQASYTLAGGVLNVGGSIVDGGGDTTFTFNGGTLNLTGSFSSIKNLNVGSHGSFERSILVRAAMVNDGLTTVHGRLTVNGSLNNGGTLVLDGGTVDGTAPMLNNGIVSGWGTLGGSGGFKNNGTVRQSGTGSVLELANSGANVNAGNWLLDDARSLRLVGGLANSGTMLLAGGQITGPGTLVNQAGGSVSGFGRISGAFKNEGVLAPGGGTLTVDAAFTNHGRIQLESAAARLNGGNIDNQGAIEGHGSVGNAVANYGSVQAMNGTLTFWGGLANKGRIGATSGALVVANAGLASNVGSIELAGGGFDNNGHALDNGGVISGFGSLRAASVLNRGQLQWGSGNSEVRAKFVNDTGAQIVVSGAGSAAFYGSMELRAGSELRVSDGAIATFFGLVSQRNGALLSGSGSKYFEGGFEVGNSPGNGFDAGTVHFGSNNRYVAEIGSAAFDHYAVAGLLDFGGVLVLSSWEGATLQAGQHFDLFDWGSTQGHFGSIDSSGLLLAPGTRLDVSRLYIDGSLSVLSAVPEPASMLLMLGGIGCLSVRRRCRVGPAKLESMAPNT